MVKELSITLSIFFLLIYCGCKKAPTCNPFDQYFDISIAQVIKSGCDTLPAGCGYFNLIEKTATSKMYYQIYSDDFYEVVAKGYVYHIDTFKVKSLEDYYEQPQIKDSLIQLQFDINKLNEKITKYNYTYLDRNKINIRIVNKNDQDTLVLKFNIARIDHPKYLVRNLEYFKGNPLIL